jgi:tetratricopeptide (TPR) repeat protein
MKRAYRYMSAVLLCVALLTGSAAFAAPQDAASQKPAYTLAEYNAYQDASKEPDPQAKIKKLDAFVATYPQSSLLPYVYRTYYLAYYQQKNYPQTLAYVDKLLALGDKIDIGSRLEGYIARAQAYGTGSSDKSLQTPDQYTAARDAASKGLDTLGTWQKPANMTDDAFATQKKSLGILFNNVGGLTSSGLKDYKGAQTFYKAALAIDPKDAVTHYRLGVAYLQDAPPATLDGYWELSVAINLKVPGDDQVRAYLKNQLLHYQQLGCDKLADDEVASLITGAAAGGARPATFTVPSADDLKAASADTANFMPWLEEGMDHGKLMWLATCGLEYPDVPVRVMESKPGDGDNLTLEVYRPAASDPDAAAKEMDAATMPNMEVHVVAQPEAKRVSKDDYVRFTGTLSSYQPPPMFLLTWDNAKINTEDIPAEKAAPGAKRPAHKLPAAKQ